MADSGGGNLRRDEGGRKGDVNNFHPIRHREGEVRGDLQQQLRQGRRDCHDPFGVSQRLVLKGGAFI